MRARWFSWSISGPSKATWQRTLTVEQKADWKSIVEVFRGNMLHIQKISVLPTKGAMGSLDQLKGC